MEGIITPVLEILIILAIILILFVVLPKVRKRIGKTIKK